MSSEQQEIWNNLKWAGVDAESAWGKEITAATKELQAQRAAMEGQIEVMDGARDAGREFFDSLREGEGVLKSLEDAFGKFADALYDWAVDGVIEQLFGKQGQPAGGASGGWIQSLIGAFSGSGGSGAAASGSAGGTGGGFWAGLIGSLFGSGGGRASGGDVFGNRAYMVGEQGPEMFVPRTAGTIIPNDQTESWMSQRSDGGTINFLMEAPTSTRTQAQLAANVQYALNRNQRNR
jgi:hypothetical protein